MRFSSKLNQTLNLSNDKLFGEIVTNFEKKLGKNQRRLQLSANLRYLINQNHQKEGLNFNLHFNENHISKIERLN